MILKLCCGTISSRNPSASLWKSMPCTEGPCHDAYAQGNPAVKLLAKEYRELMSCQMNVVALSPRASISESHSVRQRHNMRSAETGPPLPCVAASGCHAASLIVSAYQEQPGGKHCFYGSERKRAMTANCTVTLQEQAEVQEVCAHFKMQDGTTPSSPCAVEQRLFAIPRHVELLL